MLVLVIVTRENSAPDDEIKMRFDQRRSSAPSNNEMALHEYLQRQGRNEYINLASQIGYDGQNIAFIFYENQIRRLMNESPYDERRLEVLRASCIGQPREMVNLFCAPMKSITTSQRIEKALGRLRQRYGVSGGLTSEPKIIAIRNGSKVAFNASSMKMYNEDLNTLEVYAFAHDEVDKLSGQLLIDTASRLPNLLKRRYLDYLDKKGLNMSRPGFDSLRDFVAHEIDMMTSEYAQAFFKSDDKEHAQSSGSKTYRVRQTTVGPEKRTKSGSSSTSSNSVRPAKHENNAANVKTSDYKRAKDKPAPTCFVCMRPELKHFLADCEVFKSYSDKLKRQTVMDAKRCLNCLSLQHFVRDCPHPSKCRKCSPNCQNKHSGALHDYYVEGSKAGESVKTGPYSTPVENEKNDKQSLNVHKISAHENSIILLRTSAVKIANPLTGKSTLAYAQHDTASQATLISDDLKSELGLKVTPDHAVSLRTLADLPVASGGRTNFKLESLHSGEEFMVRDALVVPKFSDDVNTLPHAVDTTTLKHFQGVHIPVAPGRVHVDVLIGQADKSLLAVLEEREGADPEEPNYVLTRLGPIASGGKINANTSSSNSLSTLRVNIQSKAPVNAAPCDCTKLKEENAALKKALSELELQDEMVQPSRNEELAHELTVPNIKVVDEGRYEIPVPLKSKKLEILPDNYDIALNRTLSLRKTALRNPQMRQTLTNTFHELISQKWIEPVECSVNKKPTWHLPFFVTKSVKPRVVYDGATTVNGVCLNQLVLAGENLLNGLVEVLTRFRMGKYACVTDLSRCFFQIKIPTDQRDLFRLVWFKDNDLDNTDTQIYRFTRHVWGINSSPFIALLAMKRLAEENPTNACQLTLNAVTNNRYMDDLLLAACSLKDLQVVAEEGIALFNSRGFKLSKWVANCHAKEILNLVSPSDLAPCFKEVDLCSDPLPISKTLGLTRDPQNDNFRINVKEFSHATTRREMTSQLASQFDPLGMIGPYILGGKLILQKATAVSAGWDDLVPVDIQHSWKRWLESSTLLRKFFISRNILPEYSCDNAKVKYQLHGFCDASNSALCCVVYLRSLADCKPEVKFILGKSKLVLSHQTNWIISRKELEAAKLCSELLLQAKNSLKDLNCSLHCWTDSQVVLGWLTNPDLNLSRFVKRRVERILQVAPGNVWKYVDTSKNPADVGTRDVIGKNPECIDLWLGGPVFLRHEPVSVAGSKCVPVVCMTLLEKKSRDESENGLDQIIITASDLYTLKSAWLIS